MAAPPIRYSVLVATRNRSSRLAAFITALRPFASRHDWELVVVDNGSTDDTLSSLSTLADTLGAPCHVMSEPRGGKSRALNTGLSAASGSIVVFTDDDCYLEPGYFEALDELFAIPEFGFCSGRIVLHDSSDARVTIRESVEPVPLCPNSFVEPGLIQGANMAIRREALRQVGGFDESLGPGTAYVSEDIDVVARVCWNGWAGGYFPGPTVRHHHGRKTGPQIAPVLEGYRAGIAAYFVKFLLRPESRMTFARHWYWRLRSRPNPTSEIWYAVKYLSGRAARRFRS